MVRYERFMIWEIQYGRTGNRNINFAKHIWVAISFRELVGKEKKQLPYILMTTLKITFYN